jgi:very-short-patch-repair endonuclease
VTSKFSIEKFRRVNARHLRAKTTGAEMELWRRLRRLNALGTHFRRQVPLGPYVADFACMAARLLIEVDGSQHGNVQNKIKDDERTNWLKSEGYRVVRFWNNEITENIDGVLDTIHAAIYGSRDTEPRRLKRERRKRPHPTPARGGRRPTPPRGG